MALLKPLKKKLKPSKPKAKDKSSKVTSPEPTTTTYNPIYTICGQVASLVAADFVDVERTISAQLNYTHPLKLATQGYYQALGKHNKEVLEAMRVLHRLVMKAGEVQAKKKAKR